MRSVEEINSRGCHISRVVSTAAISIVGLIMGLRKPTDRGVETDDEQALYILHRQQSVCPTLCSAGGNRLGNSSKRGGAITLRDVYRACAKAFGGVAGCTPVRAVFTSGLMVLCNLLTEVDESITGRDYSLR